MRRIRSALVALGLVLLPFAGVAHAETVAPALDAWWQPALERAAIIPPYRTQLDGSRYAASDCGPAVLGMTLDGYGIDVDTIELRRLSHTYQGTWPGRGGTALQYVAQVAQDYGLQAYGLYDGPDEFHQWTVDEIAEQVSRGRWVIPLVRYGTLPGHETSGVRFGHYILIYGVSGDGFVYHDPAYRPLEEGAGRWISRDQLSAAMDPVLVPRQAVALGA